MEQEQMTFEQKMERLENVVRKLESGTGSLD
ncbi:MAG: exodeoxyribonuclease VII small subunit, partial [Clostridia bacterium]|nr:exodeoxyribonuclease VII small subunit [Clostridia bacterium]